MGQTETDDRDLLERFDEAVKHSDIDAIGELADQVVLLAWKQGQEIDDLQDENERLDRSVALAQVGLANAMRQISELEAERDELIEELTARSEV